MTIRGHNHSYLVIRSIVRFAVAVAIVLAFLFAIGTVGTIVATLLPSTVAGGTL